MFFPQPKTLDEKKYKRDIGGVGPSSTRIAEEGPRDFIARNESPNMKAANKTYASEQILEPKKSIVQDLVLKNMHLQLQKWGEQIPIKEQRI